MVLCKHEWRVSTIEFHISSQFVAYNQKHVAEKYGSIIRFIRGINVVWKRGVIVGPCLKTGRSWVLNVQQTEARSTGLGYHTWIFSVKIHITQIFLFLKSHHLGKCSHVTFLNIGYNNISWRPYDPSELFMGGDLGGLGERPPQRIWGEGTVHASVPPIFWEVVLSDACEKDELNKTKNFFLK